MKLAHLEAGRGAPVVLLHGMANDAALWERQLAGLAYGFRVIAPDLRGFGRSGDTDGAPVSMDDYADDVARPLDALGIARAVVGGISLGGYVSLAFALRHPLRLAGLVLADTRAGADDEQARAARERMASAIVERGPEAVVEIYDDRTLRSDSPPRLREALRAMIRRQPVNGLLSAVRGMAARPDRGPALASIAVPTLVIHGTDDRFIPLAEAQALQRGIAGSRCTVLPGAGHLSCIDTPGPFNAALEAFLPVPAAGATP